MELNVDIDSNLLVSDMRAYIRRAAYRRTSATSLELQTKRRVARFLVVSAEDPGGSACNS
eukprot:3105297-Prorocentrum_lima.AAC.1